jgi:hypothetical protein
VGGVKKYSIKQDVAIISPNTPTFFNSFLESVGGGSKLMSA